MNRGSTFWRKHLSLSRAMSTLLSVSMVLSLLPSQGVAEARREILDATSPEQVESTEAVADDSSGDDATAEEVDESSGDAKEEAEPANADEATTDDPADEPKADANDEAEATESEANPEETAPAEEEPAPAEEEATPQEEEPQPEPEIATSNRLGDFITSARLEGADQQDGAFVVNEGEDVAVRLTFAERGDLQFAEAGELVFDLPASFTASSEQPGLDGNLALRYWDENGNEQAMQFANDAWWVQNNQIHVVWKAIGQEAMTDEEFTAMLEALHAVTNGELEVVVFGTVATDAASLDFGTGAIAVRVVKAEEESKDEEAEPADDKTEDEAKEEKSESKESGKDNKGKTETEDEPKAEAKDEADDTTAEEGSEVAEDEDEEESDTEDKKADKSNEAKKADKSSAKKDEEKANEAPSKTEYTYEDSRVLVTATVTKPEALPDNAQLRVTPIIKGTGEFGTYIDALNDASNKEYDASNTLLYTFPDLLDAANRALREMGFPTVTYDEALSFMGFGGRWLIDQLVPRDATPEQHRRTFELWRKLYISSGYKRTTPFPGVMETLHELRARGMRMALLSNKLDEGVQALAQRHFPDLFDAVRGDAPPLPRKPDPTSLLQMLEAMGATPAHAAYVGDSAVDVKLARNAGVMAIGVS
ncbi:MAG: HAD-IA family hydrolase, partial [Atopobiaceae bacterium]|nr:HAD-IA family hydrolase [Atopobiaceae bacterium]